MSVRSTAGYPNRALPDPESTIDLRTTCLQSILEAIWSNRHFLIVLKIMKSTRLYLP